MYINDNAENLIFLSLLFEDDILFTIQVVMFYRS